MFAFGIWDERRQELLLARDRLGVKPLYYAPLPDGVLFGSEPKAILAHPGFRAEIDAEGLAELFAQVGTATPGHGVYRGLSQVRPGTIVQVGRFGLRTSAYWTLEAREHTDDLAATAENVRELLTDIVHRQTVAGSSGAPRDDRSANGASQPQRTHSGIGEPARLPAHPAQDRPRTVHDTPRTRRSAGQARGGNHPRRRPLLHQLRHGQSPRGKNRPPRPLNPKVKPANPSSRTDRALRVPRQHSLTSGNTAATPSTAPGCPPISLQGGG